ncbi:hypothetical protein [Cellulomonas sp. PhB150]|uniref:hypothetical protein n=1 Tax=Cellulomonas sp. PhB150 TaxID=2485188 RepID=UPI000F496FDA|nr:hypothetical protein [Cellulomonas sp. PhB150]
MADERIIYVDAKTGMTLGVQAKRKPLTPAQIARVRRMQSRIDTDLALKYDVELPASSRRVQAD